MFGLFHVIRPMIPLEATIVLPALKPVETTNVQRIGERLQLRSMECHSMDPKMDPGAMQLLQNMEHLKKTANPLTWAFVTATMQWEVLTIITLIQIVCIGMLKTVRTSKMIMICQLHRQLHRIPMTAIIQK